MGQEMADRSLDSTRPSRQPISSGGRGDRQVTKVIRYATGYEAQRACSAMELLSLGQAMGWVAGRVARMMPPSGSLAGLGDRGVAVGVRPTTAPDGPGREGGVDQFANSRVASAAVIGVKAS